MKPLWQARIDNLRKIVDRLRLREPGYPATALEREQLINAVEDAADHLANYGSQVHGAKPSEAHPHVN